MIFSIYSAVLFSKLCVPGEKENLHERWNLSSYINCSSNNTNSTITDTNVAKTAYNYWVLLIVSVCLYIFREFLKLCIDWRMYFKNLNSYGNIIIVSFIILVVENPLNEELRLQRWQYHVSSITCFLFWAEMMYLIGKVPRFGKYVQMFW